MLELRRWPAFCIVFWSVRSCSGVLDVAWAVAVLVRGEVLTACSEEGALGSEGRVGGERRNEFLRIPRGVLDSCGVSERMATSVPFGRWLGEEICMVGETWVILVLEEEARG